MGELRGPPQPLSQLALATTQLTPGHHLPVALAFLPASGPLFAGPGSKRVLRAEIQMPPWEHRL